MLPETLESILCQDYPDIECIVVDSASRDGTVELLRRYEQRGVRWVSERDSGPFEAINKGWRMGTGSVLAWLNADDTWEKTAVSKALAFLVKNPDVAVVHGRWAAIDLEGRILQVFPPRTWDLRSSLLYCDHILTQATCFMRREAVDTAGSLYPAWTHDQELWLRISLAGGPIVAIDDHLANVRITDNEAHLRPELMIPARVEMTRRIFNLQLVPRDLQPLRQRAISNAYVRGFDLLKPRKLSHWRWGFSCLSGAVASDPANVLFIGLSILERVLNRFGWAGNATSKAALPLSLFATSLAIYTWFEQKRWLKKLGRR
jgi:glycosyltransferase involved in cell wall biosynthesis